MRKILVLADGTELELSPLNYAEFCKVAVMRKGDSLKAYHAWLALNNLVDYNLWYYERTRKQHQPDDTIILLRHGTTELKFEIDATPSETENEIDDYDVVLSVQQQQRNNSACRDIANKLLHVWQPQENEK